MPENKNKVNADKKKPQPKKIAPKKNKAQEDFKKRYFEYYDDIKISDRQDW